MNDSSDIFNDGIEGGGVEPSINESIRQSIQCSFVSSECNDTKMKYMENPNTEAQRNLYVMNRMNWITYLKVLFDQLESFNQNKQKHVETANFIKGFRKIKHLLPLQTRNDYYKNCSEVAFSYKEVENGVNKMPKYITWDNIIDIFLTKSFAQSIISNPKQSTAFQQIDSEELYQQQPVQHEDSQVSEVDYEEDDMEQSYGFNQNNRYEKRSSGVSNHNRNLSKPQVSYGGSISTDPNPRRKKNEDFFPSFADSLINYGNVQTEHQSYHHQPQGSQQQLIAQAPLLLSNPNLGLKDRDEDEACEIDSDYSDDDDCDGEESKTQSDSRRKNQKLEESIRSSRTATFKSVRRTSQHQNATNNVQVQNQQFQQLTTALSAAVNVQDSYYATIKNSGVSQNYMPVSQSMQQQVYYQKQNQSKISEVRNSFQYEQEDGQVELASNHSYGSSKWRTLENNANTGSSVRVDLVGTFEEQNMNYEKSTRISSLNSIQKNSNNVNNSSTSNNHHNHTHNNINNNTILSHNSSHSSQSQHIQQNISKISVGQSSQGQSNQSSNNIDLDLAGKGLKTFEIDYKTGASDKRQLRSINLSQNSLVKLPTGLEKSIQFMNLSFNKLKSLTGIESCVNLKFLNVSGNQLSSVNNLVHLQSIREVIFAFNQASIIKEFGQLKNLQLLDLSHNKISEMDKVTPLLQCKKLTVLSLIGNTIEKQGANYENNIKRMLQQVKVLDPDHIKDYSQFSDLEHICFTDQPMNTSQLILVEQMSAMNLRQFNSHEKAKENPIEQRPRSKTPNRERAKSQLGQQMMEGKMKSTVISPQREGDKRTSIQNSNSSQKPVVNKMNMAANKQGQSAMYNDNQFRLQSKHAQQQSQPQPLSKDKKGAVTQRTNQNQLQRDRSQVSEFAKQQELPLGTTSQTRDRSTSNISRNNQGKSYQSQQVVQSSGRMTAQSNLNSNNQTLVSQQTTQSAKENAPVKKVSLNNNVAKAYCSQGKITPRRNNQHTPRQEKVTHYYKKSFCQTDDEASLVLSDNQKEVHGTPSEKHTVRTAPTQESSNKKPLVTRVMKKDDLSLQNTSILSPIQKNSKSNLQQPQVQSTKNSNRPITTLKQRIVSGNVQNYIKNDSLSSEPKQVLNNTTTNSQQTNNSIYQYNQQFIQQQQQQMSQIPQSTKNKAKTSNSFVFDTQLISQNQTNGRQTPQSNVSSNRPSSQLQKFINASYKPTTQINLQSARPSTSSQMSIHQIPSQKLTNLPPKSYQRAANPGDKKSKADMSLSVLSNGNNNPNTNVSQSQNPLNTNSSLCKNQNSILQTGGTMAEDDSHVDTVSSRSMSPVLEESNNIKKLKVDLTQFMNKQ